jgi:LPXTG-motif cell wall-anchored protein
VTALSLPRTHAHVRRFVVATAGLAVLLTLGVGIAFAHDPLATTNAYVPASGSTVTGALPATILVNFQETFPKAGDVANASVPVAKVVDAYGNDHVATAVQNPANAKQLVITTNNRNVLGAYTVTWTITASDGHAVSNDGTDTSEEGGPLRFTVAAKTATDVATTSSGQGTSTTSSSSSSTTGTVIAAIVGIGLVLLIGAGALLFWKRRRRDEFSQGSDS